MTAVRTNTKLVQAKDRNPGEQRLEGSKKDGGVMGVGKVSKENKADLPDPEVLTGY